jgi:hypothetical protein
MVRKKTGNIAVEFVEFAAVDHFLHFFVRPLGFV